MIAVIDYGMGNLHSVQKALESFGEKAAIVAKPQELEKFDKLVLPGVGAFDDAMGALKRQGLNEAIKRQIKNKKIFLGICLGMQLLFETSDEAREETGLAVLKGSAEKFSASPGLKVPHMGWNHLEVRSKNCPLLKNFPERASVYFCHSYYAKPRDNGVVAASCDYGINFSAVIWQENVYGVQFHPEKSQETGLMILKNFIGLGQG
jgi:glutamine amidotransferase